MNLKALLAQQEKPFPPAGFVEAPELGEGLRVPVRMLTLGERREIQDISKKDIPLSEKYLQLIPLCVCDEDGRPIYTQDEAEILSIPGTLADRIIKQAIELSSGKDEKKD